MHIVNFTYMYYIRILVQLIVKMMWMNACVRLHISIITFFVVKFTFVCFCLGFFLLFYGTFEIFVNRRLNADI